MNRSWLTGIWICLAILVLLTSQVAARTYSNTKDGVVVALNLGPGWNHIQYTENGQANDTDTRIGFAGNLRINWAPNDNLMYGIDVHGWVRNESNTRSRLISGSLALTWFPKGQAFWVRGGVGLSNVQLRLFTAPQWTQFDHGGAAFNLGLGYEFRLNPSFALGLSYDFYYAPLGDFDTFEDVVAYNSNLLLGFTWYVDD